MRAVADLQLLRPASRTEATAALARPGARALGGGTDLLPNLRRGLGAPRVLVDLGALPGLDRIKADAAGWRIGGAVTLAALARDAGLAQAVPGLTQAAASVAGPGHRSAATVGGNLCQDTRCVFYNQSAWWRQANGYCLKHAGTVCHVAPQGSRCHATYAGDLAPALIALGACLVVAGPAADRELAVEALYRDDGAAHLTLQPGEYIAAVRLPRPQPGSASGYRKVRQRAAMDFALAGVAIALRLEGGVLAGFALGLTGTDSRALRLEGTDALLGRRVDDTLAQALGKLVAHQVSPMRSTVTPAHHRRLVAVAAAQRLLAELAQR